MRAITFILSSRRSGDLWSIAVLLVGHLLHPLHGFAIEFFLYRNVCHRSIWCSAVPVLHPRRNPDNIALSNLLDRTSPLLNPACALRHDQDLTERMRMPCAARTGLERNFPATCARWIASRKQLLNLYGPGEVLSRPLV